MLQAYGPDVRFGEHAAVALLLHDGSSTRHDYGGDRQPPVCSGVTNHCSRPGSNIAIMLGLV